MTRRTVADPHGERYTSRYSGSPERGWGWRGDSGGA